MLMNALEKLSQLLNKSFAVLVILAAASGYVFPEKAIIFVPYFSLMLGVIMFGMGLTLSPSDFREIFRHPKHVLVGILAQFTIMPGVAYVLCKVFGLSPELAVGLMLLGSCPGGTISNVITFLARGDVALSVTVTSCTTLLAPVVTPALMYFTASQWLSIDPTAMFLSIVQIILLPIAAGVLVNKLCGKKVELLTAAIPVFSYASIVAIVAAVVGATKPQLALMGWQVFSAVVLLTSLGMLLGFFTARFTGMNLAKQKTLCFEVGLQNSSLGVALATVHFAAMPMAALPCAVAAIWATFMAPLVASYLQRLREPEESTSVCSVPAAAHLSPAADD